jgi:flagellar hook-length control protein FliK
VAQRVGEILASGRIGEADSVRSVTPAAGPQTSRPTTRSGATEITGRGVGAEAGAKSADESSTRVQSDFDRLVRMVRMKMGPRHSSARLHLEPPQLGRVQVDVRMNGSELQIGVRTETLAARNLLAERAVALRTALEQWGINIERFEITADALGGHPPEFDSASDAELAGDSSGDERLPQSDPTPDHFNAENGGEPVESESEEGFAVVAEARLDIRA